MSDNTLAIVPEAAALSSLHDILRYAAGSTLIMVVAMSANYTLAYLTPVLALNFLAPSAKTPSLRSSALFLLSIALASLTGVAFSSFFLAYPLVFLPLLALMLFHIYYTTSLQGMKVWLIISLLVIPMVAMQSQKLGLIIGTNLFMNALLAIIMVWVIYLIFPKKATSTPDDNANPALQASAHQRFISAMHKILVVIPVLVLFFVFNLSDSLLILIFIGVLSQNPAAANKKTAKVMILANLGGGLAAIIAFNLLTAATSIVFLGLTTLLCGLLFAKGLFSMKPAASLFGMAFSTYLLILGNVVSIAGEAGEKVWLRIFQIGIAMVYLVIAFSLVDRLTGLSKNNTA